MLGLWKARSDITWGFGKVADGSAIAGSFLETGSVEVREKSLDFGSRAPPFAKHEKWAPTTLVSGRSQKDQRREQLISAAIIVERDRDGQYIRKAAASDELPSIPDCTARLRCVASSGLCLVAGCADARSGAMDRSADNRCARPAPVAGFDSQHSLSGTIQVHSARPGLA